MPMRLYLSSYQLGDHPELLVSLVGQTGRRAVVIGNAVDDIPVQIRSLFVAREITALAELGFDAAELDLRDYFGDQQRLASDLSGVALAWLRGGNVFMLRYALLRSGGDSVLRDLLERDALVFGGYSAGPCVLSPSLRGMETADDAAAVTRIYGAQPVWDGLGILAAAFVPHYQSADLEPGDQVAERYRADGIPFCAVRDGQVLLINGQESSIV
jgi:dipeptidase E